MPISWFPGHMNKARKELSKLVKRSDLVIELLDARMPNASRNPLLESIAATLPRIFILNKSDLAKDSTTRDWQNYLARKTSTKCLINSIHNPLALKTLLNNIGELVKHNNDPGDSLNLIIAGIPNVGKSSFLNSLCGRKVAKTGNEPAVTKGQQRIKLDANTYLIDTPGLLWPKLEDQEAAYKLAALGTIRNTAIDLEDVAWHMAEHLLNEQLEVLQSRYSFQDRPTVEQLYQFIGDATGAIGKGGTPNFRKVSETLLNDLRSGKLGLLSLEAPPQA
ncbi:MAG: ribosome biogenesis GTPase YlqF [Gammaproteobacteria bacterium]|nr:ribosome biogenesis GTPase YlqF [Gammaproteobacteria bacterium]MDD9895322.1 ribosome biogenesis GTPase YlqF [Gammaproteobacteria bacterium]MDD9960239.1 ribosome biogenesis GTPase YlqF [Gammaproteobacteria bacterium]